MRFQRTIIALAFTVWSSATAAFAANIPATAYNEDSAHSDGDKATAVVGVRRDADTTPVTADGDYHTPIFDNAGNLKVVLKGSLGTSAGSLGKAEDGGHTSGDTGVSILAVRNDANALLAGTDLDYIPLSTDNTGALRVTGSVAGTQFNEDAAHTTGDAGFELLAVRNDTAAALAGTTGDYQPLTTDAVGAVWANDVDLPAAAALADNTAANPTTTVISSVPLLVRNAVRGVTDRQIAVFDTMDVAGAGSGIAASGLTAQADDTAVSASTENQWAPVRLRSDRNLLVHEGESTTVTCTGTAAGMTGGAGAAGTCLHAAPAAGLYWYITGFSISVYETVGAVGGVAPVACTWGAGNMPSTMITYLSTARAVGTSERYVWEFNSPVKSVAAATATGISGCADPPGTAVFAITIKGYTAR